MSELKLGVHSETGQLRQVIVSPPGLAHRRLTPDNCADLLFDDVFWVKQAQKDHDAFAEAMRGEGVEVLETGAMLAVLMEAGLAEFGDVAFMTEALKQIRLGSASQGFGRLSISTRRQQRGTHRGSVPGVAAALNRQAMC